MNSPRPTNAELKILTVLWRKGPSTVRAIFEDLPDQTGYTTILKLMQIMLEKGLVTRNESDRTHIYQAAIPEASLKKNLVQDLIEKAFQGSSRDLILQALSTKKTSRKELAEIREMIESMERKTR
jgi:predicted transcriptional regulator